MHNLISMDELVANLQLLFDQWIVLNSSQDAIKRAKHMAKVEAWMHDIEAAIDAIAAQEDAA